MVPVSIVDCDAGMAALRTSPFCCNALWSSFIKSVNPFLSASVLGYSQSISRPSKPYSFKKLTTDPTKFLIAAWLDTSREYLSALLKYKNKCQYLVTEQEWVIHYYVSSSMFESTQPPIAIIVFNLGLVSFKATKLLYLKGWNFQWLYNIRWIKPH